MFENVNYYYNINNEIIIFNKKEVNVYFNI